MRAHEYTPNENLGDLIGLKSIVFFFNSFLLRIDSSMHLLCLAYPSC